MSGHVSTYHACLSQCRCVNRKVYIVLWAYAVRSVSAQILRTSIAYQPCLSVVISGDKVVISRRRPNKWNQRTAQRFSPSQDAARFDGCPDAVCFATNDKSINCIYHPGFKKLPVRLFNCQ
jgi:hypothetical protein